MCCHGTNFKLSYNYPLILSNVRIFMGVENYIELYVLQIAGKVHVHVYNQTDPIL